MGCLPPPRNGRPPRTPRQGGRAAYESANSSLRDHRAADRRVPAGGRGPALCPNWPRRPGRPGRSAMWRDRLGCPESGGRSRRRADGPTGAAPTATDGCSVPPRVWPYSSSSGTAVRSAAPVEVADEDIVVRRLHGGPPGGDRGRCAAARSGPPDARRHRRAGRARRARRTPSCTGPAGAFRRSGRTHASLIESPSTVMSAAGSALVAGPFFTLPSVAENLLPWHGQLITPFEIPFTAHPL